MVDQLAQLVVGGARHAHAEVAILDARDAVGQRARRAAPARRERGARPGDQRHEHEQRRATAASQREVMKRCAMKQATRLSSAMPPSQSVAQPAMDHLRKTMASASAAVNLVD